MSVLEAPARSVQALIRREVVLHLHDGQTSIRGFLMEFYENANGETEWLLIGKPTLEAEDATASSALAGEALTNVKEIKFMQLLGAG